MTQTIEPLIQWLQENPDVVFWIMNIILGALYIMGLYNMALKPTARNDRIASWNYRFNSFCLAAGLTCLILKVLFGTMSIGRAYTAFEFGDTLFFWAYLLSSLLDIIEHSMAYKREKSKDSLLKVLKSAGSAIYKFFKTPEAFKKLTTLTFYGFAKKATRTAIYSTTLYATVDLAGAFIIAIALVFGAHSIGLRQLNDQGQDDVGSLSSGIGTSRS